MKNRTVCGMLTIVTLLTTGCKYSGSFLQMNSDAPMPFLGLQLSVSADRVPPETQRAVMGRSSPFSMARTWGTAKGQPRPGDGNLLPGNAALASATAPSVAAAGTKPRIGLASPRLQPVSRVSEFQGRVRYALSEAEPGATMDVHEVQLRLNGF